MGSPSLLHVLSILSVLFNGCSAAAVHRHRVNRAVSTPSFTVSALGQATDAAFPLIHRDGGGGGVLDNKNWIVFSDTTTGNNFASNTYAEVDPTNPTNLTDFGANGIPTQAVPWAAELNENASADFIWPSTSITTRSRADTTGYAVYPFGSRCNQDGCAQYNTLCQITASTTGLAVERLVPKLFTVGQEPQFGTFATAYHVREDTLYLVSADGKIARVPFDAASDKSQYTYWTGGGPGGNYDSDSAKAAPMSDTQGAPVSGSMCGFSTGDVFWSAPHQTWLVVYMTTCADSTFYLRYSTSGRIEGPWSAQQTLYQTQPAGGSVSGMNYAGHAYPQFLGDRSGREVLLSWTEQPVGGYEMGMAKVTFL